MSKASKVTETWRKVVCLYTFVPVYPLAELYTEEYSKDVYECMYSHEAYINFPTA